MTEQISKFLKDYLDELSDIQLSEFKWYLSQYTVNGSRPLQRSQLESSTRMETVDKMVQAFGGDGAVVTVVDVLYRMKLNDLATRLVKAKIDRDAEEQQVEEAQKQKQDGDQTLEAPEDLVCSVCMCIFQMPVMLQCGHSFCRTCVQQTWAGKVSRKCPLCMQVNTGGEPQVNISLKSLSENYREMHVEPTATRTDDSPQIPPQDVRKKREDFKKVRDFCSSAVEHVKRQSGITQRKIKEEFEELSRCLKTEEANRLAALKQEETQKIRLVQMILETSRNTFSLSDTVQNMEELATDGSFLTNFKSSLERFDFWSQVMSAEGLAGRCYWETEWSGRAFIGAAYRSMSREGEGKDSWLGKNQSSWGLNCTTDGFRAWHNGLRAPLSASPSSSKLGVFLDWSAGTLAFYTVADGVLNHRHTFSTTFSEPVHAAFRLGWVDSTVYLC